MFRNQDTQSLREDFQFASQDFHMSQPWETMRMAFEGLHGLRFQDQMVGELGGMEEEIAMGIGINSSFVLWNTDYSGRLRYGLSAENAC